MKALGEDVPGYKIRDMVKEVDIDENGTVEFNEFVEVRVYMCLLYMYYYTIVVLLDCMLMVHNYNVVFLGDR